MIEKGFTLNIYIDNDGKVAIGTSKPETPPTLVKEKSLYAAVIKLANIYDIPYIL